MKLPDFKALKEHHKKTKVEPSVMRAYLQRVPPSWSLIEGQESPDDVYAHAFRRGDIQVLVSLSWEEDHNIWIHVSLCGRRSATSYFLPSWEQVKRVKNDFIGKDNWAYQVFPSEKDYINQNPNVLHLYSLLENKPAIPDFTRGLGTI